MTGSSGSGYLDARYGRREASPGRTRLLIGGGLAVLLGLTAVLFAWSRSAPTPTATVSGYVVASAGRTTVSFTVAKADGQRVSCRVVAQDRYTDVVGSVDVTVPAAGTDVPMTVDVPTRGLAVVGLVDSCRALG